MALYFEKIKIFLFVITYNINCGNMSNKYEIKKEEIKRKIEEMDDNEILKTLENAFVFNRKAELILYAKSDNSITGYIKIANKMLKFKIWFSTFGNTKSITVGSITKIVRE
jgi:hypothetical protein